MRELIGEGWSPSSAAAAILSGAVAVRVTARTATGTAGIAPAEATDPAMTAGGDASAEVAERLVVASRQLDAPALELVLDDLFSRGSFERVGDRTCSSRRSRRSAMRGRVARSALPASTWRAAPCSGAGARAGQAAGIPRSAAVPASWSGCRRALVTSSGALAFAVAARRAGLAVTYVGADLPVADWVTAARAPMRRSSAWSHRASAGRRGCRAPLRDAHPDLIIAFGGAAAPEADRRPGCPHSFPSPSQPSGRHSRSRRAGRRTRVGPRHSISAQERGGGRGMRLQDKVSIITGGASGMGRVAARMFAAEGAKVVVADVTEPAAQSVVDEVTAAGGRGDRRRRGRLEGGRREADGRRDGRRVRPGRRPLQQRRDHARGRPLGHRHLGRGLGPGDGRQRPRRIPRLQVRDPEDGRAGLGLGDQHLQLRRAASAARTRRTPTPPRRAPSWR